MKLNAAEAWKSRRRFFCLFYILAMTFRHAIYFLDGLFLESSKQQQNFIATIKGKFHKWAKEEIEIESRQKEKKKKYSK